MCIHAQSAQGDELAQHATQLLFCELRANAKSAQACMAILLDFFRVFPAQDVHHMAGTKGFTVLLVDTVDGREQHAGRFCPVPNLRRLQAVVAIATCHLGVGLPKIAQQSPTTAVGGFGQGEQCIEFASHDLFEVFPRGAFIDHAALVDHIVQAIGHPRVSTLAVAPSTARLLVIAFDVFRHI